MKLQFTIPGPVVPKQRGRMVPLQQCKKCGRKTSRRQCACGSDSLSLVTVLNSPATETVHYENLVKLMASEAMKAMDMAEPTTGALKLIVEAWFAIPDSRRCNKGHSLSERNGCKKLHVGDYHAQRCDLDNAIKSISDGLNGVAFYDDSQIAALEGAKYWSDTPHAVVTLETLC